MSTHHDPPSYLFLFAPWQHTLRRFAIARDGRSLLRQQGDLAVDNCKIQCFSLPAFLEHMWSLALQIRFLSLISLMTGPFMSRVKLSSGAPELCCSALEPLPPSIHPYEIAPASSPPGFASYIQLYGNIQQRTAVAHNL